VATISAFGAYLPQAVISNAALAEELGCPEEWIVQACGIRERRQAEEFETVPVLGAKAAEDCLRRAGLTAADLDLLIVSSSSAQQRFPGPASLVAHALGLSGVPALDVPVASAGSLFALSIASWMSDAYARILVVAAERMTPVTLRRPLHKNTAILFGDGAGACLVTQEGPGLRVVDSVLHSDGAFAGDLRLGLEGPLEMNGQTVILQAHRKIPAAIQELLARQRVRPSDVAVFVMHQANQNLTTRVARALDVPADRFLSNIELRGNTSSASMLIAAAEYFAAHELDAGARVCFTAFGAGFHWGALLAEAT
jgi:3-oxoacyl-[acyl-carrier-protein] synthase-3